MSIVRNYLTYTSGTETPDMFHTWGAYVCISSAIARRVWLPHGEDNLMPNLYVMFIGEAGSGKTTAIKKIRRVLNAIGAPTSKSVETPEGFTRWMAGTPNDDPEKAIPSPVKMDITLPNGELGVSYPVTILANEFVDFISKNREGWTNLLNDIYDEDFYTYRTKNAGEDCLENPYLVLAGCLPTEISNSLQDAQIIHSGFARRTLFQFGTRKFHEPHPIPEFLPEQEQAFEYVVEHCKQLHEVFGAFSWEPTALDYYKQWYVSELSRAHTLPSYLKSWYTTRDTQVLKVAMLTSLSETHNLVITLEHLQTAIRFITVMEKDLYKIFGGSGRNILAAVAVKVLDYIEQQGRAIPFNELAKIFYNDCNMMELGDVLRHLLNAGSLAFVEYTEPGTNSRMKIYGTPGTINRLANELKAGGE